MTASRTTRGWSLGYVALLVMVIGLVANGGAVHGEGLSGRVIRGKVVSVGSEEPVAGATVIIRGIGRAKTNRAGRYRIRDARDIGGLHAVAITATGHLRRKTWLRVPDSAKRVRADWNVMSKRSLAFDSALFHKLTRRGLRGPGTSRWEEAPVVRILTRKIDCPGRLVPDERCPEWVASSAPVSSVVMRWFEDAIQELPKLMGGLVPEVELVDLPAGASVPIGSVLARGAMTVGERGNGIGNVFPIADLGEAIEEFVYLVGDNGVTGPRDILRAVAFGLGYRPPAGDALCADLVDRGLRSVHCLGVGDAERPTELDVALGRALYTRPAGNRFPDTDPKPRSGRDTVVVSPTTDILKGSIS